MNKPDVHLMRLQPACRAPWCKLENKKTIKTKTKNSFWVVEASWDVSYIAVEGSGGVAWRGA